MNAIKEISNKILNKISRLLGNTDISTIGDGTVTGAISAIDGELSDINRRIADNRILDDNFTFTTNVILYHHQKLYYDIQTLMLRGSIGIEITTGFASAILMTFKNIDNPILNARAGVLVNINNNTSYPVYFNGTTVVLFIGTLPVGKYVIVF